MDDTNWNIQVRAAYTDNAGHKEVVYSTALPSSANAKPTGRPLFNVADVMVGQTLTVGQIVTAELGSLSDTDGLPSADVIQWQWLRGNVTIDGATKRTYVVTNEDHLNALDVRANYYDNRGYKEQIDSRLSDRAPTGGVGYWGLVDGKSVLNARWDNLVDPDGLPEANTFQWQWLRNGNLIAGESSSTHTGTTDDIGAYIQVRLVYTDKKGYVEAVHSRNDLAKGAPRIVGVLDGASILTAFSNAIIDQDGVPTTLVWQWLRDGVAITGASASTYTQTLADEGRQLSVRVTYTDNHNSSETVSSANLYVPGGGAYNRLPTGDIGYDGQAGVSEVTLTAQLGTLDDLDQDQFRSSPDLKWQWLRDGNTIAGATDITYIQSADDVGRLIGLQLDYIDNQGQHNIVQTRNHLVVGVPLIRGVLDRNSILTADTLALSDADGLPADTRNFHWQWLRNGVEISNATGSTYQQTTDDASTKISLRLSYRDKHGYLESAQSDGLTISNTNADTLPTGKLLISPASSASLGLTLNADLGTIVDADVLPAPNVFQWQWLRDNIPINLATGTSYALTADDWNHQLTVKMTYTDTLGNIDTAWSEYTRLLAIVPPI